MRNTTWRTLEGKLLLLVFLVGAIGFLSATIAGRIRQGQEPGLDFTQALIPVLIIVFVFAGLHAILSLKGIYQEQIVLPATALLFMIGMTMIWRLREQDGATQQIIRGLIPGSLLAGILLLYPPFIEKIRQKAFLVGLGGLALLGLTGLLGVQDETGARLALKLGPLPSIQTSEMIKVAMIIFLAWYIEREGQAAEGRAHSLLFFRLPGLRYLLPAAAFVGAATLALVAMSDYGAVIILGVLFIGMLYIGFQPRIFMTIAGLGVALALLVGFVLSQTWKVPATIQYRFQAFANPWSTEMMPNGIRIAEGPGYQIQQAVYAVIAGGVSGTGIGLGSPDFIPLAHSDFILAAIMEEMGSAVGIAVFGLYGILILRTIRLAILLPRSQVFERLLLTGIAVHFFTQVFIMASGTLNLIPLTGVTVPFLSQGGASLIVNFFEIGCVLALSRRVQLVPRVGTPV